MDINSWLTIVTVLIAMLAFFPQEERKLIFLKMWPLEIFVTFFFLVVLIPGLIYFPELSNRFNFFQNLTVNWGVSPKNLAFGVFYLVFLWIIFRLIWAVPKTRMNERIVSYYKGLLNEHSFDRFFRVFKKYTTTKQILKHWDEFEDLVFDPIFLRNVLLIQPEYLLHFWEKFDLEEGFKRVFRLFLENKRSLYYEEIKQHSNSHVVQENSPFLKKVLVENLNQSIDCGLLKLITDHALVELHNQNDIPLYKGKHFHLHDGEEQGFILPVYYHIKFIDLLYSTAIESNQDVDKCSGNYRSIQTVYSTMIEAMVREMNLESMGKSNGDSTNYHWLISEIFSILNHWLRMFNEERYYEEKSSYVNFIATNARSCLFELYRGYEASKVDSKVIAHWCYYGILTLYLSPRLRDSLRSSIEREVILCIPKDLLKPIFDFSLNEAYAISYVHLQDGIFDGLQPFEKQLLNRLREVLDKD